MSSGNPIRWLRQHPGIILAVVIPAAVLTLYWWVYATPHYISTSQLTVKSSSTTASFNVTGLAALIGGTTSTNKDSHYLVNRILSQDMLKALNEKLHYRERMSRPDIDWYARLDPDASRAAALRYYQNMVHVQLDDLTGIISLQVEAFDPAYAQQINDFITKRCEEFINEISQSIARGQVQFMQGEVTAAKAKLDAAKNAILAFQNKHDMLDPTLQAQSIAGLLGSLEAQVTQLETEYRAMTAYLNPTAPQAVAMQNKISSLKVQLKKERARLAGSSKGDKELNALAARFAVLTFNVGFAQKLYETTLAGLEQTRVSAAQKIMNVVNIASATLPSETDYRRRIKWTITAYVVLLMFYLIGRFAWATVKDHRD